jgi:hypothetical protein
METANGTPFTLANFPIGDDPSSLQLTIVLKGTFRMQPDGPCTAEKTQLPLEPDKIFMDELGRGPSWASDYAPFKPHSDFFILGAFHAPGGVPVTEALGGFSFGPFRKDLLFFGPRFAVAQPSGARQVSAPAPVTSIPLRWELSFGGLEDARNPLGRGLDLEPGPDGVKRIAMPQIEWPDQRIRHPKDRPPPANFSPLPPGFLERRHKLGTRDRRWAVSRAPLLPKDYDPSYHNAAPQDQQAGNYPRGDEKLVLRNLHPRIPELATELPGLRIRAGMLRRAGEGAEAAEVTMNLDTVIALPDEDHLVLLWRGGVPLRDGLGLADILRLQIEAEKLSEPAKPFAEIAAEMLAAHKASLPPPPSPPPEPPNLETAMAGTLARARETLAKVDLPPDIRKIVETERDPQAVHDALAAHVDQVLGELAKKYGVKLP